MQFIPIVEWIDPIAKPGELNILPGNSEKNAVAASWNVDANDYGNFLVSIFNELVRNDMGDYFIASVL